MCRLLCYCLLMPNINNKRKCIVYLPCAKQCAVLFNSENFIKGSTINILTVWIRKLGHRYVKNLVNTTELISSRLRK